MAQKKVYDRVLRRRAATQTADRSAGKEIVRLKEENEFLAEARVFFAASRRKLTKT